MLVGMFYFFCRKVNKYISMSAPEVKCKGCGGTKFKKDIQNAVNDISCEECGWVLEENPIVADLQFGEGLNGASIVSGSFIKADQSGASSSLKSKDLTFLNAKRRIQALAASLNIPGHISDSASKWFYLALTQNFIKGRKSQNVIAACLYIACRKEKTHHMLVDFSAKLQISVYSIGSTFLKMVKNLHITSLPLADPSLFIQHFADNLNFGKKKIKVMKDAIKLAHRMSSDWIFEGRRPAGIAGACILLAARMNNFRRTHTEIVAIAHVGEETLQKRLNEFKNTNSSAMSINEFRNTDNKEIEPTLPPAYTKKKTTERNRFGVSLIQRVVNVGVSTNEINEAIKKLSEPQKDEDEQKIGEMKDEDEQMKEINANRPKNLNQLPTSKDILAKISDSRDNFDDIDDSELDRIMLSEEESKIKEKIFINLNRDYLFEQEEKRLKRESDEFNGGQPKKKKRLAIDEKFGDIDAKTLTNAIKDIGESDISQQRVKNAIRRNTSKLNHEKIENLSFI